METGKTLQGSADLVFDTTHALTHVTEGMYRNIAATAWPLGEEPEGPAPGIAGFVHEAVRSINTAVRTPLSWILGQVAPSLDRRSLPGPHREALISALNGICGDHLERSDNALAIPMQLRVLLPATGEHENLPAPGESTTARPAVRQQALANLFEVEKRSVEVHPQPTALADKHFSPGGKLLVVVHGLSMNEREWTHNQHNHAEALAESGDFTPVYVRYNSGRNISTNGRELSEQLADLLQVWPTAVESITFIGFSMGGLLTRSAMQAGEEDGQAWLAKVDKAVYLGSPHHGAVMERGGFWLQKSLTFSPYTAPLAALGRARSAGITDLRHGNVQDNDWQHQDEHEDNADNRSPTPLPGSIAHYAIAGTLSKRSGDTIGRLLGDGLVHPSSATGRHENPKHHLAFPEEHTKIIYDVSHLSMLQDARVMDQLKKWLL